MDSNDYPPMQVLFMLYTVAVLVAMLISDIVDGLAGPAHPGEGVSETSEEVARRPGGGRPATPALAAPNLTGMILLIFLFLPGLFASARTTEPLAFPPGSARPPPLLGTTCGPGHLAQLIYGTRQMMVIAVAPGASRP